MIRNSILDIVQNCVSRSHGSPCGGLFKGLQAVLIRRQPAAIKQDVLKKAALYPISKNRFLTGLFLITAVFFTSCGSSGGGGNNDSIDKSLAITAFSFTSEKNSVLSTDVTGVISGSDISVTVPYGTTVTGLVATFTTTGASVAVGSTTETSGVSANDFTNPVTYRVTAADGSTQDYTVTVTVAAASAKEITAFSFTPAKNPGLSADVTGIFSGTSIAVSVPYGTTADTIKNLVATFTTTGASVKIGSTVQTSGTTANDFTSAKTYTVTAADGSTQSYTVTMTIAADLTKAFLQFGFMTAQNSGLTCDVLGTITGTSINVTVPYGTAVTGLKATYKYTNGCKLYVGSSQLIINTYYSYNYTNPVTYTIKGADGSTQNFTVTVTVAPDSTTAITSFSFPTVAKVIPYSYEFTYGNIYGTTFGSSSIAVSLPYLPSGSTSLAATFTANGTVTVGGVTQESGVTLNDFANPVTYRVTAADGSWQDYTVTVIFAPGINSAAHTFEGGSFATYWTTSTSITTDANCMSLGLTCIGVNADSHTYSLHLQVDGGTYYNLEARAALVGATVYTTTDERVMDIYAPSLSVMKKVLAYVEYVPPASATELLFWEFLTDNSTGLTACGRTTIVVVEPE